jgi:hypothetical protein
MRHGSWTTACREHGPAGHGSRAVIDDDLYTRRTDGHRRILRALGDADDGPDDDGSSGVLVPVG